MSLQIDVLWQIGRYGFVTLISYVVLLGGLYVCVDIFHFPSVYTYVMLLCLVYVGVYFVSSHFVFFVKCSHETMQRFMVVMLSMWVLNIGAFYILESFLHVQYLLAAIINIAIFGLLRFLIYKNWVFKRT